MELGPFLELHGERKRLNVPQGLKPLLEDMTMEILREQPSDIYLFLMEYLECRLGEREEMASQDQGGEGQDQGQVSSGGNGPIAKSESDWAGATGSGMKSKKPSWETRRWSWEGKGPSVLPPDELKEFLDSKGVSKEKADENAVKIQSMYRGYNARKNLEKPADPFLTSRGLDKNEADRMATKIQAQYKGWKARKGMEKPAGVSSATQDKDNYLSEKGLSKEVADEKATKIQSAFRGHQARKEMERMRNPDMSSSVPSSAVQSQEQDQDMDNFLTEIGLEKNDADKMATKIQSRYRGYKTRKDFKDAHPMQRLSTVPEDGESDYWAEEMMDHDCPCYPGPCVCELSISQSQSQGQIRGPVHADGDESCPCFPDQCTCELD